MKPTDLPPPDRYAHGTRARYVSGCRCEACRERIRLDAVDRTRRLHEAAAEVAPNPGPPRFKPVIRKRRDGTPYEIRARACPGTGGTPCVAGGAWLKGRPVCIACVDRAVIWNGMVDAAPVRAHLRKLARRGVGHKSVAAACDVSKTVLADVLWGGKTKVRKHTADRVLAVTVDAAADGARIDARPTWKLVREMLEAGLSKGEIGGGLGQGGRTLQLGARLVEAQTALAVRKLHARVMAQGEGGFVRDPADARFIDPGVVAAVLEELRSLGVSPRARLGFQVKPRCVPETFRKLRAVLAAARRQAEVDARAARLREAEEGGLMVEPELCPDCGASHAREQRQARLARLLPLSLEGLREALPCFYDGTEAGERRLYRDLRAIGAERVDDAWTVPSRRAA
jgi:hypothetical protein